jgi:hypothetical protein
MYIHSHSEFVVRKFSSILFLLAPIYAAPVFAAQNQTQLISLQSPLTSRIAIMESCLQKVGVSRRDSNAKRRLYVTVINMSGKPRQAALGKTRVDLPVAQHVVLQMHLGDTLRVVSDADSKIKERFTISERDDDRILIVQ